MIIDVHTHRYPAEVRADPAAWAAKTGEGHWCKLVTQGLQGWASGETMRAAMEAGGVEKAVLLGWYWENQDTADRQNEWHLRWAAETGERWLPFVAVQPKAGARAVRAVEAALATGMFRGVGELMPTVQCFDVRDAVFCDLAALARSHDVPILLHVTEPAGHHYLGRVETPLEDYVWLGEHFPENKWIFAHWGGGLPFYCLNRRVAAALRNTWFDTAAGPLLYRPEIWARVRDLVGADRILFGTDYPLRLYPRSESEPGYHGILDEFEAAPLNPDERAQILGGNARRLLRLD